MEGECNILPEKTLPINFGYRNLAHYGSNKIQV
jgi:hypothetical protein